MSKRFFIASTRINKKKLNKTFLNERLITFYNITERDFLYIYKNLSKLSLRNIVSIIYTFNITKLIYLCILNYCR